MKLSVGLALGGALAISGAGSLQPVHAQAPVASVDTSKKTYELRLRNIKPSLMAFWLDPQNNERPAELGPAFTPEQRYRIPAPKNNAFALPEGIDRIVAVDPQHALLVFGTPEGVAKLWERVNVLDGPLRQVEIEAQFVSIKTENLAALGIDFSTARGNNTNAATLTPATGGKPGVQLGFVRGNFQAALATLQGDNAAKVLSAPRVTAINTLPASITSAISSPVVIGTQDKEGHFRPLYGRTEEGQLTPPPMAGTSLYLNVTPTINNDGTVTVRLKIDSRLQLQNGGQNPTTLQTLNGLETIANIRDGETIALVGFDPTFVTAFSPQAEPKMPIPGERVPMLGDIPLIGQLFRSKMPAPSQLIVFVTARIVRPAGK